MCAFRRPSLAALHFVLDPPAADNVMIVPPSDASTSSHCSSPTLPVQSSIMLFKMPFCPSQSTPFLTTTKSIPYSVAHVSSPAIKEVVAVVDCDVVSVEVNELVPVVECDDVPVEVNELVPVVECDDVPVEVNELVPVVECDVVAELLAVELAVLVADVVADVVADEVALGKGGGGGGGEK